MSPSDLAQVLRQIPPAVNPEELLVGLDNLDDAGIYRLNDEVALVQTVDFFTPVVDDPRAYGQIAAANALSDVYAMGGQPLCAMNIVCFPRDLDLSVLGEIVGGAVEKLREAGVTLVGGHSVEDPVPKFGLAVTGTVHPDKIVTNSGARPGDYLVLTKPLGTGVINTAAKRGEADPKVVKEAVRVMATLNRAACEAMKEVGVNACTDVTGFGLLGHAWEMARASRVALRVRIDDVPLLPGARDYVKYLPGGSRANREYLSEYLVRRKGSREDEMLLCDAQTSGGLLMAVRPEGLEPLLSAMRRLGVEEATPVGEVVEGPPGRIEII